VEKREHVDETKFLVDFSTTAALNANEKRRKSIVVRPLTSPTHAETSCLMNEDSQVIEDWDSSDPKSDA